MASETEKPPPLSVAERDWNAEVKGRLRAELKLRGMTYADLAKALARIGVAESEANLRNKISRGGFSAVFFVQCLEAVGGPDAVTSHWSRFGPFTVRPPGD